MLSDRVDYRDVLAFMVTSAVGLFHEPKLYGPLRLLESASMLIEYAKGNDIQDETLDEINSRIKKCTKLVMTNEEKFEEGVNEILKLIIEAL
ncbi:DUF6092 family protein [Calorimonas adulescens]|jgi:hypothetical protein|uniref:Uncharacterized protein n=1 Tax=Calorimonas adulescens TaxID=2606906 RepID=A0A5D8QGB3_9THEO|nr:DUF6092 family protein [Calorimonas adulescens]TZE82288.1 hypothetical protein FWJ32_05935 [Calorimonas adulescens]